ncbi:Membrane proteinase PrsW, cleaves anti-sigma factor RsiW, M82 family [Halopelagius inordinatus]|uniref:Membrane proteinase PrsW, cleaves anti-sigma factor RsiW, M82 family n=1 Tax=Halopelagius inordinatus TaxID=553467 RepID=A0A1I2M161_9EURY|nr:PrsW family intramembrane metalloprotease [Halopelagius inordinatus]SFF84580.1 Membrane proteinase PrsW, cleaves anti-sigma factor RsiW, M82 family [Halopelagius inordinatus]
MAKRDPVQKATDDSADLYDISTWEERTSVDGLAVFIYRVLAGSARIAVVAVALLLLLGIGGLAALTDPQTGILTLLSAIPALGLAAYVYYSDATTNEPLSLLVGTFLLGVLTANFAAVLNGYLKPYFGGLGFVGTVLFFYLVVGPVEETVKLLAVRLFAYTDERFSSVVDGAVYGAMAGLGFATIENALYITRELPTEGLDLGLGLIGAGGGITAVRALAGPGHVIYSAIAGYYLGLAKFNRGSRGPIIIKGLLIATFVHATYNSTVGIGSAIIATFTGLGSLTSFLVYILIYDGIFGLYLLRKIKRYNDAYHDADATGYGDQAPQDD